MWCQMDFLTMGLIIFELWIMETELWDMKITHPNSLQVGGEKKKTQYFDNYKRGVVFASWMPLLKTQRGASYKALACLGKFK